jgi:hypothetical protein
MSIELVTRFDFELTDLERSSIGALFPAHWGAGSQEVRAKGWVQREPAFRVLAIEDSAIVGQAAVAEMTAGLPRGLGIGDVVVAETHRQKGICRLILTQVDRVCAESGAEFTFAASRNFTVRKILRELGYSTPRRQDIFFRLGDHWCWNETWLLRGTLPNPPVELLGDF